MTMKKALTIILTTAALLLIGAGAMTQGGASPFLGSTHTYTVTMADGANNTAQWVIADDEGTALETQPSFTTNVDENTATMEIRWTSSGDFKIQFTENRSGRASCRERV